MPQIANDANPTLGASNLNQRLTFRDRLMERFAAHEWVRVFNPDDEPFYWQYLPSHSETVEFTPDPMKITRREPVESWMIEPEATEVIIGENAYLMIEGLYKKLITKGFLKKNGPNPAGSPGRNFNWSDAKQQEDMIAVILKGKESPQFKKDAVVTPPATPRIPAPTGRLRTPG